MLWKRQIPILIVTVIGFLTLFGWFTDQPAMKSFIDDDFSVCLFPENIQHKDINDMVSSGIRDIKKLIDENIYRGLEAKVRFNIWRKVDA